MKANRAMWGQAPREYWASANFWTQTGTGHLFNNQPIGSLLDANYAYWACRVGSDQSNTYDLFTNANDEQGILIIKQDVDNGDISYKKIFQAKSIQSWTTGRTDEYDIISANSGASLWFQGADTDHVIFMFQPGTGTTVSWLAHDTADLGGVFCVGELSETGAIVAARSFEVDDWLTQMTAYAGSPGHSQDVCGAACSNGDMWICTWFKDSDFVAGPSTDWVNQFDVFYATKASAYATVSNHYNILATGNVTDGDTDPIAAFSTTGAFATVDGNNELWIGGRELVSTTTQAADNHYSCILHFSSSGLQQSYRITTSEVSGFPATTWFHDIIFDASDNLYCLLRIDDGGSVDFNYILKFNSSMVLQWAVKVLNTGSTSGGVPEKALRIYEGNLWVVWGWQNMDWDILDVSDGSFIEGGGFAGQPNLTAVDRFNFLRFDVVGGGATADDRVVFWGTGNDDRQFYRAGVHLLNTNWWDMRRGGNFYRNRIIYGYDGSNLDSNSLRSRQQSATYTDVTSNFTITTATVTAPAASARPITTTDVSTWVETVDADAFISDEFVQQ